MDLVNVTSGSAGWISFDAGKARNIFKDISFRKAFLCLAVMGSDWGLQESRIKESTNFRRLITGFLGGFGFYSILVGILKKCVSMNSRNMKEK